MKNHQMIKNYLNGNCKQIGPETKQPAKRHSRTPIERQLKSLNVELQEKKELISRTQQRQKLQQEKAQILRNIYNESKKYDKQQALIRKNFTGSFNIQETKKKKKNVRSVLYEKQQSIKREIMKQAQEYQEGKGRSEAKTVTLPQIDHVKVFEGETELNEESLQAYGFINKGVTLFADENDDNRYFTENTRLNQWGLALEQEQSVSESYLDILSFEQDTIRNNMRYEMLLNRMLVFFERDKTAEQAAFLFNGLEDSLYFDGFCDDLFRHALLHFSDYAAHSALFATLFSRNSHKYHLFPSLKQSFYVDLLLLFVTSLTFQQKQQVRHHRRPSRHSQDFSKGFKDSLLQRGSLESVCTEQYSLYEQVVFVSENMMKHQQMRDKVAAHHQQLCNLDNFWFLLPTFAKYLLVFREYLLIYKEQISVKLRLQKNNFNEKFVKLLSINLKKVLCE